MRELKFLLWICRELCAIKTGFCCAQKSAVDNSATEITRASPLNNLCGRRTLNGRNLSPLQALTPEGPFWHHYVTREPGAFDQHDVFAKNRYLLRIFPPSSGALILDEDEL